MKYPCYVYRDIKEGFGAPMLMLNEMIAKREFSFDINQEGSMLSFAPSDYELYCIGNYDTDNGQFESVTPVYMCNGMDVYGVNAK